MSLEVNLPFTVRNPHDIEMTGVPLRASVPMPEGAINDPAKELSLVDEADRAITAQWKVLAPWPDGSVRFLMVDHAVAKMAPGESRQLRLVNIAESKGTSSDCPLLQLNETDKAVEIDTGRLCVKLSKKRFSLFEELYIDGKSLHVEWAKGDMISENTLGQIFRASDGEFKLTVEDSGPARAVVLVEGKFGSPAGSFLNYRMRYHFVAGCAHVLLVHTVRNREEPRGGVDFRRISIEGSLAMGSGGVRRIMHTASGKLTMQKFINVPENVDIDIETEVLHGGPILRNWTSLRQDADSAAWSALQKGHWSSCSPIIDLHDPEVGGMCFSVQNAGENAPVRLASDRQAFTIDVFPAKKEFHHFNQGMGKTRDIQLSFQSPDVSAKDAIESAGLLSWPGVAGAPAEWYRKCKVASIHRTLRPQRNRYLLLEMKIETLLRAEVNDIWPRTHGWRDYGDEIFPRLYDFSQFGNNEEDYIYAQMLDAWRKGQPYAAAPQARHLMDIDYIDFSTEPQRDGGDCPHGEGHTDGEVYPSHQWCEGLMHFYLATGDPEALRISKRIGDNLCYWINGPYRPAMFFTSREAGWPLQSLACLYDYTREKKYIDAALSVINELCSRFEEHGPAMYEYPAGSGHFIAYNNPWLYDGLWEVYRVTGDQKTLGLWKALTKPVLDSLEDPDSSGYIHFRNQGINWPDLTVLDHWYELTGDERYVRLGKNGLKLFMTGSPDKSSMYQAFIAMGYRHFIFFLKLADEFGMIDDEKVTFVW